MQIAKTAKKLQSYVQELETEYKAAEKERERKQLQGDNGSTITSRERTKEERDEMAQFLSQGP